MADKIVRTDIPFGSGFAYRRGQLITAEAVEANGWADYVVGRDTKEGKAIIAEFFPEMAEPASKVEG